MNRSLLSVLGISTELGLKEILSALEEKQFEDIQRLESVSDEGRRKELEEEVRQIEEEISHIKEEMKSLRSSIILDEQHNAEKEAIDRKEEQKQKHKEKIEELKAKEAEKKIKEESKSDHIEAGEKEKTDPIISVAEGNSSDDLTKALTEYKKQNYTAAFSLFKGLAEDGNAQAQYILAVMYQKGEGVLSDGERAEFWLKKSADANVLDAQFSYGMHLLSTNNGDEKRAADGMMYLGGAADQDYQPAMEKYVELIAENQQFGNVEMVNRALTYCERLKTMSQDSFDQKRYRDFDEGLKDAYKSAKLRQRQIRWPSNLSIVGSILLVFSAFLLYLGIHYDDPSGFASTIPGINSRFLLPIDPFWELLSRIMNTTGMLGLEILLVAQTLLIAGSSDLKSSASKAIAVIARIIGVAMIVWHFYTQIQIGESVFEALGYYIILLFVFLWVGTTIGGWIKKIAKI